MYERRCYTLLSLQSSIVLIITFTGPSLCSMCSSPGTTCTLCSSNSYFNSGGSCSSSPPTCPSGYYLTTGATSSTAVVCARCSDANCANCGSSSSPCYTCNSGYYLTGSGGCTNVVPTCPSGQYAFVQASSSAVISCKLCLFCVQYRLIDVRFDTGQHCIHMRVCLCLYMLASCMSLSMFRDLCIVCMCMCVFIAFFFRQWRTRHHMCLWRYTQYTVSIIILSSKQWNLRHCHTDMHAWTILGP